jgi:hypothetical protein
MSRVLLGVICGLVFGAIDIGIMLPMSFPDKKAAITAAFIARFGIGFVIGAARLPWPGWAVGLCFGLLLSIPDAVVTENSVRAENAEVPIIREILVRSR